MKSPQRATDIHKKLAAANIVKGYKSGFNCIYKLEEKGYCQLIDGKWQISETGKQLLNIIRDFTL